MRRVRHVKSGVVVSVVVAGVVGVGAWLYPQGFRTSIASVTASCSSSCTGPVTLTATVPPQTTSVNFLVDGSSVGTDSSAPFSVSWDSTTVSNAAHLVTVSASGSAGSAVSSALTLTVANSPSADIYIAQTAAGAADGTSCANAKAATFFNTAGNWGVGAGKIGPGKTVGLCGTITSQLGVAGSGTAGNPITILFQAGAKLSESACPTNGCLWLGQNQSYLTVNGNSTGIIESTDNGTGLGSHTAALGVFSQGCSHCIVENLTIQNMYVRTSSTDENLSAIGQYAVEDIDGHNNSYTGLTIHDSEVGFYFRSSAATAEENLLVASNTLTKVDHNIALAFTASGNNYGPILIHNNSFSIDSTWDDTAGNFYHHSFLHCFTSAAGSAAHITGLYIYNNVGTVASDAVFNSGGYFLESAASSTPCDDNSSNHYFFNNVILDSRGIANGLFQTGTGSNFVYNNTVIGPSSSTASDAIDAFRSGTTYVPSITWKNNVFTTLNSFVSTNSTSTVLGDYNIYGVGGSRSWEYLGCSHYPPGTASIIFADFSTWQGCGVGESHSSTTSDAKLSALGVPQAASPIIAAGTNLTTVCNSDSNLAALCSDINGSSRPTGSTAWDIGAVNH